jgi:hypothetical protein
MQSFRLMREHILSGIVIRCLNCNKGYDIKDCSVVNGIR